MQEEHELRTVAKKEVSNLLSTRAINIRKDVEKHREQLQQIFNSSQMLLKRRESLE